MWNEVKWIISVVWSYAMTFYCDIDNGPHGRHWIHLRRLQHLFPDCDRAAVCILAVQHRNSDTKCHRHSAVHGGRWNYTGTCRRRKGAGSPRSRLNCLLIVQGDTETATCILWFTDCTYIPCHSQWSTGHQKNLLCYLSISVLCC